MTLMMLSDFNKIINLILLVVKLRLFQSHIEFNGGSCCNQLKTSRETIDLKYIALNVLKSLLSTEYCWNCH